MDGLHMRAISINRTKRSVQQTVPCTLFALFWLPLPPHTCSLAPAHSDESAMAVMVRAAADNDDISLVREVFSHMTASGDVTKLRTLAPVFKVHLTE